MIINGSPVLHSDTVSLVLCRFSFKSQTLRLQQKWPFAKQYTSRVYIPTFIIHLVGCTSFVEQKIIYNQLEYERWKVTAMWDVPPYSLVERYKRFGEIFYLHLQGKNVTALLFTWRQQFPPNHWYVLHVPGYMTLEPRKPICSLSREPEFVTWIRSLSLICNAKFCVSIYWNTSVRSVPFLQKPQYDACL